MLKGRRAHLLLSLLLLTVMSIAIGGSSAKAQRVYSTSASGVANAVNAQGASSSTPPSGSSPATISVTVPIAGSATGNITFQFPTLPANTTVYVKVSNISGGTTSGSALKGSTPTTATGSTYNLITAPDGTKYFAISATEQFDKVRITTSISGLLGATATSNIFFAYYETTNAQNCGVILGTSFSGGGLLGGTVNSPNNAIDGDLTTASSLIPAALLSSVEQTFNFSGLTTPNDQLKITFSVPPAPLLDLSVLSDITLTAYQGNSSVLNTNIGTLISLDLLNLLRNGNPITVTFIPNQDFDKVKIDFKSVANVLGTLKIHEVERVPAKVVFSSPENQNIAICTGSPATFTVTAPGSGKEVRWYTTPTGGTPTVGNSFTPNPSPTVNTTYYVAVGKVGCAAESERVPTTVTISLPPTTANAGPNQLLCSATSTTLAGNSAVSGTGAWSFVSGPNTPVITTPSANNSTLTGLITGTYVLRWTISNGACTASTSDVTITVGVTPTITLGTFPSACREITLATLAYTATTGSPATYSITWAAPALTAGFANVSSTALPLSPITITVPVNAPVAVYSGTIKVKNAVGCESSAIPFTLNVHPKPASPSFSVTTN